MTSYPYLQPQSYLSRSCSSRLVKSSLLLMKSACRRFSPSNCRTVRRWHFSASNSCSSIRLYVSVCCCSSRSSCREDRRGLEAEKNNKINVLCNQSATGNFVNLLFQSKKRHKTKFEQQFCFHLVFRSSFSQTSLSTGTSKGMDFLTLLPNRSQLRIKHMKVPLSRQYVSLSMCYIYISIYILYMYTFECLW